MKGYRSCVFVAFAFFCLLCKSGGHAKQCYQPVALPSSSCCKKCNTFGCLVNAGRVDEHTPCDPLGKNGKRTWAVCDGSGCDGTCRNCRCEALDSSGKFGVWWDLVFGKVLFYASVRGESKTCAFCGNSDGKRREEFKQKLDLGPCPDGTPPCKKTDERCSSRSECCGDNACRSIGLGPQRCRSCFPENKLCSIRDQCCPGLGCYGIRLGPSRCRKCVQEGAKCEDVDQCCGSLKCKGRNLFRSGKCMPE